MRDFTRQGVAPDPNWPLAPNPSWLRASNPRRAIEPEPVFQLTRKLHADSAMPPSMGWPTDPREDRQWLRDQMAAERPSPRPSALQESRLDVQARHDLEVGRSDSTELDEDEPIHVPATRRQIAVRIIGSLAIVGTIFGAGLILRSPDAFRQALDWATLGHADAIMPATH